MATKKQYCKFNGNILISASENKDYYYRHHSTKIKALEERVGNAEQNRKAHLRVSHDTPALYARTSPGKSFHESEKRLNVSLRETRASILYSDLLCRKIRRRKMQLGQPNGLIQLHFSLASMVFAIQKPARWRRLAQGLCPHDPQKNPWGSRAPTAPSAKKEKDGFLPQSVNRASGFVVRLELRPTDEMPLSGHFRGISPVWTQYQATTAYYYN